MGMRTGLLWIGLAGCHAVADPPPVKTSAESAQPMPAEQRPEESFSKAFNAFRDFSAKHFGVAADQVVVVQGEEAGANDWSIPVGQDWLALKTGRAWAFESVKSGTPGPTLRGYALPDGTVVTHKQNLGRWLEEAGVWQGKGEPEPLGHRLVWMLGMAWSLEPYSVPTLEVAPDGSGKLSVSALLRPPGPGTWQAKHALTITFTPDRKALLALPTP